MTRPGGPAPSRRVELVRELRTQLTTALRPLVGERRVALLGVPAHDNLGDAAILMGELQLLEDLGSELVHLSTLPAYEPSMLERLPEDVTLLLHGGGNFGDIWPKHQDFREDIVRRSRRRPIVLLPQTFHFASSDRLGQACAVFADHPSLTLLVRDVESLARVSLAFVHNETILVPDAAFTLSLRNSLGSGGKPLWLRREDLEALDGDGPGLPGWRVEDWPHPLKSGPPAKRLTEKVIRRLVADTASSPQAVVQREIRRRAARRVSLAASTLTAAPFVVTERMHGHILCLLLDIPHVVVDNSYGKTRTFVRTWNSDAAGDVLTASREAALDVARRLYPL
jgi:exopolysaccharide biosynthesis predicted pyruvyltransferase EpsI